MLSCKEVETESGKVFTCKTWSLSTTKVVLKAENGNTIVFVEDTLPTLWTPQPYGRISTALKKVISKEFAIEQTNCQYGFGLFGTCEEWRKN